MGALRDSAIRANAGSFHAHPAGPPLEPGSVVADRFVVREHLGRSRYGQVYRALDRKWSDPQLRLEQYVALHVLDDRIRAQTRLLQKLETSYLQTHLWAHPNIVKIRGFGSDRGTYFLCTELLEGRTLRAMLDEIRPNHLSPDTVLSLLGPVGDALTYAHDRNAVHGDIRPETIFVTTDRSVKVLDLLPASSARSTPFFVEDTAPNGLFNPDPRDDVYGLACLAYELLANVHPFNRATALEALNGGMTPMPIAGLAPAGWDALARGLALRRAQRTSSVSELLAQMRGAAMRARAVQPAAAQRGERLVADEDIFTIGEHPRPAPPRPDNATARDERPVGADRAAPREPEPDRAPDYVAFRAKQLREPWQPGEPLIAPRDMRAYRENARRRARRGSRAPARAVVRLLSIGIVAALAATAYLTYEPFQAQVRQVVSTGASAIGIDALDAFVTGLREDMATVAPDPSAPPTSVAGASERSEPLESPVASTPAAAVERPRAADAAERAVAFAPEAIAASAALELGSSAAAQAPSTEPTTDAAAGIAPTGPARIEPAQQVVTVSENHASAAVVIHRQGGSLEPASVTWWTSDGTAVAGEDYADLGPQVASFAAGQDTHTILVPIIADSIVEDRESFYVNVTVGDATGMPLVPDHRVEVVIAADDR